MAKRWRQEAHQKGYSAAVHSQRQIQALTTQPSLKLRYGMSDVQAQRLTNQWLADSDASGLSFEAVAGQATQAYDLAMTLMSRGGTWQDRQVQARAWQQEAAARNQPLDVFAGRRMSAEDIAKQFFRRRGEPSVRMATGLFEELIGQGYSADRIASAMSYQLGLAGPQSYSDMYRAKGMGEYAVVDAMGMTYGQMSPWRWGGGQGMPRGFGFQPAQKFMLPNGMMKPMVEIQAMQMQSNYDYTMAGIGLSQAGLSQQITGTRVMWGYQDQMRDLNRDQARKQEEMAKASAGLRKQQLLEEHALQQQIFEENIRYQTEIMGIERQHQLTKREWAREDMAIQRERFEVQSSWQLEDIDRGIKFATGREKIDLMRHRDRMEEQQEWERSDLRRSQGRFETQASWEDDLFERQRVHFETMTELQRQLSDMQLQHPLESMDLENSQRAERLKNMEAEWALEDQMTAQQRKMQEEGWKNQQASLALQAKHAKEMLEYSIVQEGHQITISQNQATMNRYVEQFSKDIDDVGVALDRIKAKIDAINQASGGKPPDPNQDDRSNHGGNSGVPEGAGPNMAVAINVYDATDP
ncbi:MAG: hypothetical protein GX605_09755, partial [Chloroflexi bacterium]|nr:hypothetical protein [Chloroflexota bacterium]